MKIEPLNDRVVIRQQKKKQSRGGIYLPDSAKEVARVGEVVAAGPGKLLEDGTRSKMSVKKGDLVVFARFADEVIIETEKFIVVQEEMLLGIVRE